MESFNKTVHVTNIDYKLTESDLQNLIHEHLGDVTTNIFMPLHNNTSNNRGWANIEFETEELATKFIDIFNNFEINNRKIIAQTYKKKTDRNKKKKFFKSCKGWLVEISNLDNSKSREQMIEFLRDGEEQTEGFRILEMPFKKNHNCGYCLISLPFDDQRFEFRNSCDRNNCRGFNGDKLLKVDFVDYLSNGYRHNRFLKKFQPDELEKKK